MPIYRYRHTETGREIEVIRDFSDYECAPTAEEGANAEELAVPEKWVRLLSGFTLMRPVGWGKKGEW